MESEESSSKAKKLKDVCRTRWVQRIDSYIELLPAVHKALNAMACPDQLQCIDGDGAPPEQLTSTVEYYSDDLPHPLMFSRFGLKSGRHTVKYMTNNYLLIFSKIVVHCSSLTSELFYR